MKGTFLAFVSAFVVLNATWLYSIISSFDKDMLQWIEEHEKKMYIEHQSLKQIQISRSSQIKYVIVFYVGSV